MMDLSNYQRHIVYNKMLTIHYRCFINFLIIYQVLFYFNAVLI